MFLALLMVNIFKCPKNTGSLYHNYKGFLVWFYWVSVMPIIVSLYMMLVNTELTMIVGS